MPKVTKKQKPKGSLIGGGRAWSDSGEDEEEKTKDETCLEAQASNEFACSFHLLNTKSANLSDNDGEDVILDGEISGALIIVEDKEKSILE
ncbi:hypothetical protein Tco_0468548 [Tanacetum coccineum]